MMKSDCFAHQKLLLIIFGFLPNQNIFYKLYSFTLLIVLTIYPVLVVPEILKTYYENFDEFIFSVMFNLGHFTAVLSMHCIFWNRSELTKLFGKLQHMDELANLPNAREENAFIKPYQDLVRKQSYFGTSVIFFVLIAYTSVSVVLSLNKEKWLLPFGSGAAIINNNNMQFILQLLLFGTVAIVLYLLVFIYINVLTLICGHCKQLQKFMITSLTDQAEKNFKEYNAETKIIDWEPFKVQLQHIVPYHVGIIDAANQMETTFSLLILTFFGGVSICLCLLIYHSELNIAIMDVAKDIIGLLAGYMLLIVISNYGEKIGTESSKIASICYEIDFANCDVRIQKSLILIMARSQRPITPTIGKLKVLSLRTMLSIFQSIYTYYAFLKNMKGN